MKYLLLILFAFIISCKQRIQPESPEKLFEKYRKAVVLIRNAYYYEVDFSNGTKLYFNSYSNGKFDELSFVEEEIQEKPNVAYGTGFFISNEGLIATNRHVVSELIDQSTIYEVLRQRFNNIRIKMSIDKEEIDRKLEYIETYVSNNISQIEYSALTSINEYKDSLTNVKNNIEAFESIIDFDPFQTKIFCKTLYLGVAFENTFVNRVSDFKECVVVNSSTENDVDLALIQLKDKITPPNIKTWFDFSNHNPNIENKTLEKGEDTNIFNKLKIDYKVYMIGFNQGFELANTTEGIKAQLTQGTVSQESDQIKVLYSIPTLSGSSGSPVIDQWGNLIAINFAKISNSQSFNYGILSKHLKELKEK